MNVVNEKRSLQYGKSGLYKVITFYCRILSDNAITSLKQSSVLSNLPNLVKIDVRRNQINTIEDGAFLGAHKVTEL